ncbi:C45 family autoproteolytic acyltransferase/hydrolase [Streptomyces sp. NPDC051217]|uniref:C45 family autoproteolytic acyltransferase/hydolase n=1 Tax=Streptomyces sp. NPDC051217 TaxID=3365644 RepID=UPI0037AA8D54
MAGRAIPLIEVSGGPGERGHAYGEAARGEIRSSVDYYREAFAVASGLRWPEVLDAARQWRGVVEGAAPDLLKEMDAIAEGAGVRPDEILALNARGEIVRGHDSAFAPGRATEETDGCSSFALMPEATGDSHVYCGQNWDWREGTQASTVMLRVVQPPRPTVIMQVEAGQIGRQGANSAGIALNANGLDGRFGTPVGLPQPVMRRLLLDCDNLRDALDIPNRVRQHIATNLLVTHHKGVAVDLETTPVIHRWATPVNGVLVHGNHYQYGVPEPLRGSYRMSSPDSLYRVQVIERGLAAARDAVDSAQVRKVVTDTMSDHTGHPYGVCCHPDSRQSDVMKSKTIMSSLVDLTSGEYRVAAGNPCETPFELLPWNLYDGPGGEG